jgi:hypothetical protein
VFTLTNHTTVSIQLTVSTSFLAVGAMHFCTVLDGVRSLSFTEHTDRRDDGVHISLHITVVRYDTPLVGAEVLPWDYYLLHAQRHFGCLLGRRMYGVGVGAIYIGCCPFDFCYAVELLSQAIGLQSPRLKR